MRFNGLNIVAKLERCVLDLTVSQLTVTLLLFVFLEYSYIIMYEYASIIHNYQFVMLITMIHVFYKLLEIYHNILFLFTLHRVTKLLCKYKESL
jgi:hypothetical protein